MGRALAAPAAGQGYSRSLLHIPVMGPWDPNKSEEKVRQTHPNYDEQRKHYSGTKIKVLGHF